METLDVKVSGKNVLRTLPLLKAALGRIGLAQVYAGDEAPLRSELFSSDQMKRHGEALAHSHKLSLGSASDRLLTRLAENEDVLMDAHNLLTEAVKANRRNAPAEEWLPTVVPRACRWGPRR